MNNLNPLHFFDRAYLKWGSCPQGLVLALFILFGLGLVQVYSSSYVFAIEKFDNGFLFFHKQLLFTCISLGVLFVTALFPISFYQRWGWIFWCVFSIGVGLTFLPHLGVSVSGAHRWLQMPFSFRLQPSEFLKVALALLIAHYLNTYHYQRQKDTPLSWGLVGKWLFRIIILVAPVILLLYQPDFGSFILMVSVVLSLIFVVGISQKYFFILIGIFLLLVIALIIQEPYRVLRIIAFMDPWQSPQSQGMQLLYSMLGFYKGGLTGLGLGLGQSKLLFLPEAHTDFTFSVLAEETGFIGSSILMILYGFVILQGFKIVARTAHLYQKNLALGLVLIFSYSVFVNMGVVLGLMPTKGLALPFLSYGGSSLVSQSFLFGLLLNIDIQNRKRNLDEELSDFSKQEENES